MIKLLIYFMFLGTSTFKGEVIDVNGNGLPGVKLNGKYYTDLNGQFNIPISDSIKVEYISYKDTIVKLSNKIIIKQIND